MVYCSRRGYFVNNLSTKLNQSLIVHRSISGGGLFMDEFKSGSSKKNWEDQINYQWCIAPAEDIFINKIESIIGSASRKRRRSTQQSLEDLKSLPLADFLQAISRGFNASRPRNYPFDTIPNIKWVDALPASIVKQTFYWFYSKNQ